jgi:hypothetical protein
MFFVSGFPKYQRDKFLIGRFLRHIEIFKKHVQLQYFGISIYCTNRNVIFRS